MLLCDVAEARWLESHPRIRITSRGYASGIRCRYLGGNDNRVKNISKSKFDTDWNSKEV